MKTIKILGMSFVAVLLLFTSCKKDDDDDMDATKNITLNLTGLKDLGADYVYEGWIIVDGAPVTTGTFTVDGDGTLSQTTFTLDEAQVEAATKFVLSIEPTVDADPAPSDTKYLAGDFSGTSAAVTTGIVSDFSDVAGEYILATPTDGMMNNELSGIWWLNPTGAAPVAGLTLPVLPAGWKYEGWVVTGGQPVSTGTFTNVSATDEGAPFSGSMALPAPNGDDGFFPGEDFIVNAPSGLTFPTDLTGGTAVISVEPYPDNSAAPFELKPLVGMIPADATDHTLYQMGQNLDFPAGTVVR